MEIVARRKRKSLKMTLIIEDKRKVKDPRPTTQGSHTEVITVFIRKELSSDLLCSSRKLPNKKIKPNINVIKDVGTKIKWIK